MNYWIFKANPEHYQIGKRLLDPAPDVTWAVTRYHDRIKKGDIVFIWQTGSPRGICAVMEIDNCPYEPEPNDLNDGFELPSGSVTLGTDHWAKGHFTQRFPVIETGIIKKIPGLELFSFFSAFQQAINYSVTRPEGTILLEFIEKYLAEGPVKKPEKASKPALKAKNPQPARVTTRKQKPVEAASKSSNVTLLKCEECGRYVVSGDTDRHIREAHAGQPVEWQKMK